MGGVGKRGDRSRLTLAKIVRGIATGDVRRHLEGRESVHKTMANQLAELQANSSSAKIMQLQQEITLLVGSCFAPGAARAGVGSRGPCWVCMSQARRGGYCHLAGTTPHACTLLHHA